MPQAYVPRCPPAFGETQRWPDRRPLSTRPQLRWNPMTATATRSPGRRMRIRIAHAVATAREATRRDGSWTVRPGVSSNSLSATARGRPWCSLLVGRSVATMQTWTSVAHMAARRDEAYVCFYFIALGLDYHGRHAMRPALDDDVGARLAATRRLGHELLAVPGYPSRSCIVAHSYGGLDRRHRGGGSIRRRSLARAQSRSTRSVPWSESSGSMPSCSRRPARLFDGLHTRSPR